MRDVTALWIALLLGAAAGAQSKLTLSGDQLVEGRETILSVAGASGIPLAGVRIEATYRENAHPSICHTQNVGKTEPDGTRTWVPEQAGVVVLRWTLPGTTAPVDKLEVAVRHDGIPGAGIAVAVIAGFLLLGGSLRFLLQMLSTDE